MIPTAMFAGLLFAPGPDAEISTPSAALDIEGEQALSAPAWLELVTTWLNNILRQLTQFLEVP